MFHLEHRDRYVKAIARHFDYSHLSEPLAIVSKPCHDLAEHLLTELRDGPDLDAGLRLLLEAKDCFVRAALVEQAADYDPRQFQDLEPFKLDALKRFQFVELPDDVQHAVAKPCFDLADQMWAQLPDDPETVVGLHKLREAMDHFIRAY